MIPLDAFGSESVAADLLQQVRWRDGTRRFWTRGDSIGGDSGGPHYISETNLNTGQIEIFISGIHEWSSLVATHNHISRETEDVDEPARLGRLLLPQNLLVVN
jgi:hypothetical protein